MSDVRIQLGDKNRVLRFNVGSFEALEEIGVTPEDAMQGLGEPETRFRMLKRVMWSMLQHEDPAPSLKEVGVWLEPGRLVDYYAAIGEVLRKALPEPNGNGNANPPKAAGAGGKSSGSGRGRSR